MIVTDRTRAERTHVARPRQRHSPPTLLERTLAGIRPARHGAPTSAPAEHETLELAERADTRAALATVAAHGASGAWLDVLARVPADLVPAAGRLLRSADLDADGFADRAADSVGVDLACWRRPPSAEVDEHGWRRVFNWLVLADSELSSVTVLTSPAPGQAGYAANYGYEAEGVAGVGVLSVAPLPGGQWRIIDCWGDACHAERVRQLAAEIA
jgi:hypothetical protein